ncbi:hypothetical protein CCUS01_11455 [Colletotrichum cuscutae]|uniref:Uncharacterized protein n=1 Tax=Colletotrichum cuscutae TaxID=1209917 RepID=A0AAI9U4D6_9PEZI|nr:hypothetical protein CCUS01_11455 [Colletotrichum cuscutae]
MRGGSSKRVLIDRISPAGGGSRSSY